MSDREFAGKTAIVGIGSSDSRRCTATPIPRLEAPEVAARRRTRALEAEN